MKFIHISLILIVVQFALTALCIETGNEIDRASLGTAYRQRLLDYVGYYRLAWLVCLLMLAISVFFV